MRVVPVLAGTTHDLRRRVLREGRSDAQVRFVGDEDRTTLHLAVVDDQGRPLAVATTSSVDCPLRGCRRAWKVRGMAVEPDHQGEGLGTQLLDEIHARAVASGIEVLWADARDTALSFYGGRGWSVQASGYITADTGLAHHMVIRDLVGTT